MPAATGWSVAYLSTSLQSVSFTTVYRRNPCSECQSTALLVELVEVCKKYPSKAHGGWGGLEDFSGVSGCGITAASVFNCYLCLTACVLGEYMLRVYRFKLWRSSGARLKPCSSLAETSWETPTAWWSSSGWRTPERCGVCVLVCLLR